MFRIDADGNEVASGSKALGEVNFLQLSGRLVFGEEADANHVETRFKQVFNDPFFDLVEVAGELRTRLALAPLNGEILSKPSHHFGDPTKPLEVRLSDAGDAFVVGLSITEVTPPTLPDRDEAAGLAFERDGVTLSALGAHAEGITLRFPAGFGVSGDIANRRLISFYRFKDNFLTPALLPRSDRTFGPFALPGPGSAVFCSIERLPVWLVSAGITWRVADGILDLGACNARYVAAPELERLENFAAQVPAVLADGTSARRWSNEHVFRLAKGTAAPVLIRGGPDGTARVDAELDFDFGTFTTHFPRGTDITWDGAGRLVLANNIPDLTQSWLEGVHDIVLNYNRNCPGGDCGDLAPAGEVRFTPAEGKLAFTRDGGLRAEGAIPPHQLEWGAIDAATFAQSARAFSGAAILVPGDFLAGADAVTLRDEERPGGLLLSGIGRPGDADYVERPHTPGYDIEGAADYAGLNFRVGADGTQTGASVLTGKSTGDYPLTKYSKYYLRPAGISGVHDAQTFPAALRLYGFDTSFRGYSIAYLDSRNVDSRTDGALEVPFPSGFTQEFEQLRFGCRGQLLEARVPAGGGTEKSLEYWTTPFRTLTIQFKQPVGLPCAPPGDGALALGVRTQLPLLSTPVHGTLGFIIHDPAGARLGDLTSASDKMGVDSRLEVPTSGLPIDGPGGARYTLASVINAYFNRYLPGAPRDGGFVNFAGRLNVPFFTAMPVHVHATPGLGASGLHFTGGWEEPGGQNFFNNANFDPDNRGFPAALGSAEAYRASDAHRPHARKLWLDLVNFDFPVKWEGGLKKAFGAAGDAPANLRLIEVPSRLRYLSSSSAEIQFGAEIKELPRFSPAQLLGDVIDRHTGAFRALEDALRDSAKATGIIAAADRLDELTKPVLDPLLDPSLRAALDVPDALVDQLYARLLAAYADGTKPLAAFQADFCAALDDTFLDKELQFGLARLFQGAGEARGLLEELRTRVHAARDGATSLRDVVKPDAAGQHPVVGALAFKLTRSELASALLQQLSEGTVQKYIEQVGPTFNEITRALNEVDATLGEAETQLAAGGGQLSAALQQVTQASTQLQQLRNRLRTAVCRELNLITFTPGALLAEYAPAQLKARLRHALVAEFYGSFIPERFAFVLRASFGDSRGVFRQALDEVFAQVNRALRDALLEKFGDDLLPADVNKGLGTLQSSFQGAKLSGYARINGDSLEEARVDGKLGLTLEDPSKPFAFEGWVLVSSRKSDRPGAACRDPGARATTIAVGATVSAVVGYGKHKDGAGIRASVDLGVALSDATKLPLGMDGSVVIGGDFPMGDFNLEDATLKFAAGDGGNYLAGVARGNLNGIEADIRAFLGQSCDIGALKVVDLTVQAILDLPDYKGKVVPGAKPGSLIGFYVAADGAFPLEKIFGLPSTCVLSLRALGGNAWFGFVVAQDGGRPPALLVGRRQSYGLHGRVLCAVEVKGQLDIAGAIGLIPSGEEIFGFVPDVTAKVTLVGHGNIEGKFGICPFCVKASKDVTVLLHLTPAIGPPPAFVRFSEVCYEVRVDDLLKIGGCIRE